MSWSAMWEPAGDLGNESERRIIVAAKFKRRSSRSNSVAPFGFGVREFDVEGEWGMEAGGGSLSGA